MKVSRREFASAVIGGWAAAGLGFAEVGSSRKRGERIKLFNGKNLEGWYTFLRPNAGTSDVRGKNVDPEGIFKVADGEIHILGKEFGYIATVEEYDDFHLSVEFKWGEKKFAPRDKPTSKRDSGILYRFPADKEDRVWPTSIECQIQEGDCGDFWLINGTSIVAGGETQNRFFKKSRDAEKPNGKWNRVEVVADGDRCTHIVNGVVVNEGTQASVSKGRIVIQSEGAEVFFRKIELRPLRAQTPAGGAKI